MSSRLDEPITLESYNLVWPLVYQAEVPLITEALAKNLVAIEHFGSTAILGMIAKPIIDMLVGVSNSQLSPNEFNALQAIGYEYMGEAGVPGRLYFRKRGQQNFNLAVVKWNSKLWRANLAFRDYLRSHPAIAERYSRHKQNLVKQGINQLLEYSHHKENIISEIMQRITEDSG